MASEKVEPIYEIEVKEYKGRTFKLAEFRGKVLLIVNVASKCGLALRSYEELTSLLAQYHRRGLRILLFPCQQFLNQESSDLDEVKELVRSYSEDFMLMEMANVLGKKIHPLYEYLSENLKGWLTNTIKWNFTYFLIDRNGKLVRRYGPTEHLKTTDPDLVKCIGDAAAEAQPKAKNASIDFEDDPSSAGG